MTDNINKKQEQTQEAYQALYTAFEENEILEPITPEAIMNQLKRTELELRKLRKMRKLLKKQLKKNDQQQTKILKD